MKNLKFYEKSSIVHEVHVDVGELGILEYLQILVVQHLSLHIFVAIALPRAMLHFLIYQCVFRDVPAARISLREAISTILSVRAEYVVLVAEHSATRDELTEAHLARHTPSTD